MLVMDGCVGRVQRKTSPGDSKGNTYSTQCSFLFLDVPKDARLMYCSLFGLVAGVGKL